MPTDPEPPNRATNGPDCTIVLLVPHPERRWLLTTTAVALPTATLQGDFETTPCLDAIESTLGVLPPILRIEPVREGHDRTPGLVMVDLETVGARAPDGFAWSDWASLQLDGIEPEIRGALARWIRRRDAGPTPLDPPWARPGWFARASRWMTDRMREAGRPLIEPPRVVRLVGISTILRAASADGPIYFKCSAPISHREAAVTALLASTTPNLVTPVLAVDRDQNWLLMDDLGQRTTADGPPEAWAAALDVHAAIQRAWLSRTEELIRAGADSRPLATLAQALPRFAELEPLASELTDEDRRRWHDATPAFIDACLRLDELNPTPTILHGDLHPWNVADTPDGPRIFDWSDASVGHPFLDLAVYLTRTPDVALRRSMRDGYLAHWADMLPAPQLAEAADLALIAGTLNQVDSYRGLVGGIEPDDLGDLRGMAMTASWARAAMDILHEGIDVRNPGHADG